MEIKPLLITIGVTVLLLGGAMWWVASRPQPPQASGDTLSANGLHWHPELAIFTKGEPAPIPQGIGLTGGHNPIHTHDDLPIIHLEFPGIVRTGDLTVSKFFQAWGKDMQSFGANMTMTVNGETNTEFGNYVFQDRDKVELRYE